MAAFAREAVYRNESGEPLHILGAAGKCRHTPGVDAFYRILRNGVSIVADLIFITAAIFPDMVG